MVVDPHSTFMYLVGLDLVGRDELNYYVASTGIESRSKGFLFASTRSSTCTIVR